MSSCVLRDFWRLFHTRLTHVRDLPILRAIAARFGSTKSLFLSRLINAVFSITVLSIHSNERYVKSNEYKK